MAILIKTPAEIEKMRRSGEALRQVHDAVQPLVVAGASTMDLENAAVEKMRALKAVSAFKGYHNFPAVLCTSINSEVVHGIPTAKRVLADGDIISIDCGVIVDGFYSDCAVTYAVGTPSPSTRKLLEVTEASLYKAIDQARVGGRLFDISAAVQEMCEAAGFGVVKEFVGHGIGRSMHEDPQLPNFGTRGKGPRLKAGMVLAIEPMINAGGAGVKVLPDGWTTVTLDGSYSAHFEHTVAITKDGPLILTL
ncbi:MAG TPA: type I methionyl aminopeptidase [Acidobacteriaceae bacterium]|nr:type I methionyl aminopeptidase [Acidobacteriaceae bacterium]